MYRNPKAIFIIIITTVYRAAGPQAPAAHTREKKIILDFNT